jgi:hypothetical protein
MVVRVILFCYCFETHKEIQLSTINIQLLKQHKGLNLHEIQKLPSRNVLGIIRRGVEFSIFDSKIKQDI